MIRLTLASWIDDGIGVLVLVHYRPGRPAVTSGPPERCHEASPDEIDIVRCTVDGSPVTLTDAQAADLLSRLCELAPIAYRDHLDELDEARLPEKNA